MKLFIEKKNIAIAMLVICISMVSSVLITVVYSYYFGSQQLVLTGDQRRGDNAIEWSSDGNSFTTLSDDSYIWFDFDNPIKVERLVINYKNYSQKPWRLQVYYATPEMGFDQETCFLQNIDSNNERTALNLSADNVSSIRIDWGEDAGRAYSLDSLQVNIVDKYTKIVICLLVFIVMFAIGIFYIMLDTELGFIINNAVKRLAIRNIIADLLYIIMSYHWLFWERGGDYILFCNLFLCLSCVNIADYFYLRHKKGVKLNIGCPRTRFLLEHISLVAIVVALGFLFLKNTDSAVWGIGDNYEIIEVISGIVLFIFSVEYVIIENRLHANVLLFAIVTAFINYYLNKNGNFYAYYVITFYLIAILVYQLPERKIIKRVLFVISFFAFLTYFLSTTNIYGNSVTVAVDTMKRTLGFLNPNDTSFHYLMLTILILYFNNGFGRLRLFEDLLVAAIGLGAIYYTGGRTSIMGVAYELVIIIGFIIYSFIPSGIKEKLQKYNVISLMFAQSVLLISCLGSICWSWIYDENKKYFLFSIIEHVFDTRTFGLRLLKANNLLNQYKPSLFGQYIPYTVGEEDLYVEIFYVNALLRDGIILLFFFILLVSIMNVRLWKKQQYFRLLLLAIIPVVVLGESFADNPVYNVFTFLALSNPESREDSEAMAQRPNYKKPMIISALTFVWILCIPTMVAFFITLFNSFNIDGKIAGLVAAAAIASGFIISKTIYDIAIEYLDSKAISMAGRAKLLALIVVLVAAFSADRIIVSTLAEQNADNLSDELPVLQLISDNSQEKIYADRLPALYKNKVSGVKYSYRHVNDLPFMKNVTLIVDSTADKYSFFYRGFLYMPISDKTAIYTNNPEVERLLQDNGYHLYGYNNYVNCVDLQYEAELNDIEFNDEEKIVLKDEKNLLNKGPYISLGAGKYTVSFELHMDELLQNEDGEVAVVSVSNGWGQNILGEQVITADMFDHNGDCKCDLQINGNGSGYEFKVTLSSDVTLLVEEIKYVKTPDFDTHYLVDDKWRRIHEEYYDLEGNPFERNEGYYGADYKYDEAGNVVKTTYLGIDGQPVLNTSGYAILYRDYNSDKKVVKEAYFDITDQPITLLAGQASVEYEYDEKGNTSGYKYYDVTGNPVLYDGKYWYLNRIFNDNKQIVREEYFGIDGNPIALSGGQAAVEYEYDEVGNIVVYRYYDTFGNPVLYAGNYWYYKRTFNENRQIILEEYFGTDGNPIALSDGAYAYGKEYDDAGNISKITYLGSDGAPITNISGYSAWRRYYNDSKQVIREEYYDENDDPIALSGGQGAVEYEYDENGNRSVYRYYDVNGEPVLYGGIYWGFKVTYDQNNRNVLEEYFGLDGQPIIRSDGASGYVREYDEAGNVIKITYLDAEGNPTTNTSGYSIAHRSYNAQNKVAREEYYDTDENPITLNIGQFAIEYDYDELGAIIKRRYYDLGGNLIKEE